MKYFHRILLILSLIVFTEQLQANTLFDSLNSAYKNNPKLNAERASKRASKEESKGAVSEFLPSLTISGYVSEQDNTGNAASNNTQSEQALKIEQKILERTQDIKDYE